MNWQYVFLGFGLGLSLGSKTLQFGFDSKWGDLVVIPAAICFVLAILFGIKPYQILCKERKTKGQAIVLGFLTCSVVVCFQLTMIGIIGNGDPRGFLWLIPLVLLGGAAIHRWYNVLQGR